MIGAIEASAKKLPKGLFTDSGYCSEKNLEILENSGICGYVATRLQRHGKASATGSKKPRKGTTVPMMSSSYLPDLVHSKHSPPRSSESSKKQLNTNQWG